jgi:hypothetical protein
MASGIVGGANGSFRPKFARLRKLALPTAGFAPILRIAFLNFANLPGLSLDFPSCSQLS